MEEERNSQNIDSSTEDNSTIQNEEPSVETNQEVTSNTAQENISLQANNEIDKPKEKKSHRFLYALIVCALALGCGFGGGYLAINTFGSKPTVIYQTNSTDAINTNSSQINDGIDVEQVASIAQPTVVEIRTEEVTTGMFAQQYVSEGAGSGVIISNDGYILTNNHVVEGASSLSVTTYDGTKYDATLIGTDSKTDIAVIKIDASGLTPAVLGDSDSITVGQDCVAIGNPLGTLGGTVTNGIISALNREITIENETMNLIQTNAAINSGNSGGGLFNSKGELIGVVNAKSSGINVEGLGFAIPINDVKAIIEDLISNGYVTNRPTIGVYLSDLSQDQGDFKAGLYVTEVIENSAAEKAGLQAYDRIIALDDAEVSSYSDLSKALKDYNVGDTITLTIVRNGKQMNVEITLANSTNTNNKQ